MSFESDSSKSINQSTPYDPNDEDLGPSVSMAVMANDDDDFKKSTFGMKRTTSVGKFGIKKSQFTSLSSSNISNQRYQPLTPPSITSDAITHDFSDNKQNSPRMHTPNQASASPEPSTYMANNYNSSKNSSKTNFNNQNDSSYIIPRDDAYLSQEPSNHVDYLSHNWDESEISKSWKYIILQKKRKNNENNNDSLGLLHHEDSHSRSGSIASRSGTPQETRVNSQGNELVNEMSAGNTKLTQQKDMEVDMNSINAARLENASWRTWAKARNNLKTVSPEILNWSKDNDITWLYGPIVPTDTCSPPHAEPENKKNEDNNLKPILKKRTVTEVIERNAKWNLDQIRKNYMKNHGGKLPTHKLDDHSSYRTHSPAVYGSNEANKDKEKDTSLYPHEDFRALAAKVNAQYSQSNCSKRVNSQYDPQRALEDKKMMMATLLSTDRPSLKSSDPSKRHFDSSMSSSPLQNIINSAGPSTKHIRFNDRVEQCISLVPDYNAANQKHTRGSSDEEDFKRMRKRSKIVLPSGITLGTGNGGSSDESSSSDSDWDMDSDGEDNNLQPEFIEDNRQKEGSRRPKVDYSKAYTRYYRGPALPVSDSSEGSNSDDEDDIFSLKTHINPSSKKALSMYPGTPPHSLKNHHNLNKPELLKMNSDSVVTIKPKSNKKTYPPSIKRIPATKLNCSDEQPRTMSIANEVNLGSLGDSHGYNNYDYNSVFKHDNTILDINSGINIVDVPLEYAPTNAKRDGAFSVDDAISKKSNDSQGLGGLSRTSSATSGLAKGFADSLRLNSTQGMDTLDRKPSRGGSMFSPDSDSDEEDNDSFTKEDTSRADLSFLTKTASTPDLGKRVGSAFKLNGNIGEKNNSFLSGSVSLSDASGSQSDLRENTLSRVKTRSDSNRSLSSMNLLNTSAKSVQVGKFRHNLSQPPKRSFSLFAEDSDSDD